MKSVSGAECKFSSVPLLGTGLAGVRGVEMEQEPHHRGGAGGVPIHPDARHPAPDPAVPSAAPLLFHQLLPGHVPRGGAPHCGHRLVPHWRWAEVPGEPPGLRSPPGALAALPDPKSLAGDPCPRPGNSGKKQSRHTVPFGRASSRQQLEQCLFSEPEGGAGGCSLLQVSLWS